MWDTVATLPRSHQISAILIISFLYSLSFTVYPLSFTHYCTLLLHCIFFLLHCIFFILHSLFYTSSSLYILHSTFIILSPTNRSAHRDLCSRELEYDQRKNNIGKTRTFRSLNYIYVGLSVHRNTGVQKRTKTGRDEIYFDIISFYFILFYLSK